MTRPVPQRRGDMADNGRPDGRLVFLECLQVLTAAFALSAGHSLFWLVLFLALAAVSLFAPLGFWLASRPALPRFRFTLKTMMLGMALVGAAMTAGMSPFIVTCAMIAIFPVAWFAFSGQLGSPRKNTAVVAAATYTMDEAPH